MTARHRALHGFLYEFSNFGRLPVPALRGVIEKLSPVEVRKRQRSSFARASRRARCTSSRRGARALSFRQRTERNLAFYRDGDFFGELSILNGSPRAASVEAFSDCRLFALDPERCRDLKQRFPEFGKLMEERLAQYQAKTKRASRSISRRRCCRRKPRHTTRFASMDNKRCLGEQTGKAKNRSRTRAGCFANGKSESGEFSTSSRSTRWIAAPRASG